MVSVDANLGVCGAMDAINPGEAFRYLMSADAVRRQCRTLFDVAAEGGGTKLHLDLTRLDMAADYVADTIKKNYPNLQVPFHARWRHFVFAGRDRFEEHMAREGTDPRERLRICFELAIVSVLLDAGAGAAWHYTDPVSGDAFGRSEGLAMASLDMYFAGAFSDDPDTPFRVDAACLISTDADKIAAGFQVSDKNPLTGLEGRAALLKALGHVVARSSDVFARDGTQRLGHLADHVFDQADAGPETASMRISAPDLLGIVLRVFGAIWPGRETLAGQGLGDTWRHPLAGAASAAPGYVPFHKLSQWLTYSLIEPLQAAGIEVEDINGLTGLAEYRNGGLFVDLDVIRLHDGLSVGAELAVDDPVVVEWRALTVALLDELAPRVRTLLGKTASQMPLASVLEGGTWSAGRRIANEKREGGGPPLNIISDGSVF